MDVYTMLLMLFLPALVNVMAWIGIGYVISSYFAKYSRCGTFCIVVAGVAGSLLGGFVAFLAYGLPDTLLWANNLLFAIVGTLGLVYISLPEKERAIKVELMIRSMKKINRLYIDLAGLKR